MPSYQWMPVGVSDDFRLVDQHGNPLNIVSGELRVGPGGAYADLAAAMAGQDGREPLVVRLDP